MGWPRSGLIQEVYCARHGISVGSVQRWRRIFSEGAAPRRRTVEAHADPAHAAGFACPEAPTAHFPPGSRRGHRLRADGLVAFPSPMAAKRMRADAPVYVWRACFGPATAIIGHGVFLSDPKRPASGDGSGTATYFKAASLVDVIGVEHDACSAYDGRARFMRLHRTA